MKFKNKNVIKKISLDKFEFVVNKREITKHRDNYYLNVFFNKEKIAHYDLGNYFYPNTLDLSKVNDNLVLFFNKDTGYEEVDTFPVGKALENNSVFETKVFNIETGDIIDENSFKYYYYGDVKVTGIDTKANQIYYSTKKGDITFDIKTKELNSTEDLER